MILIAFAAAALAVEGRSARGSDLPAGLGHFVFRDEQGLPERPIKVWYYRPLALAPTGRVIFVMHGSSRSARRYLAPWVAPAMEHGFLVLCPEFSREYYPARRQYRYGNVTARDGRRCPTNEWTFTAVERLFDEVRRRTGLRTQRYGIYGHSAGAQFVHRFVMHLPEAHFDTAVAANAGVYLMPSFDYTYPYGLADAGIPVPRIKRALGRKLFILLGTSDTAPRDRFRFWRAQPRREGRHRLARGLRFIAEADLLSEDLGTPPAWHPRLVIGAGHSNAAMTPAAVRLLTRAESRAAWREECRRDTASE